MLALGIHLEGSDEGLLDTLDAVACSHPDARPVLLADTLDDAARARVGALAKARGLVLVELDHGGGPEALTRLIEATEADLWGLLEVGAIPSPGSLARLSAIFEDDPRVGIAGPSTDDCWNEQGGHERGESVDPGAPVDERAPELAPLYSLATVCLFIHRRAIEGVAGPDLGYGHGPCWEMDLHARIVRSGLRGAWVRAAFVARRPVTALRRERERLHFEASRRRYQDRLCGRRLAGERGRPYASHCRGDACALFAPPALIELRPPEPRPKSRPRVEVGGHPLVSCLVPTVDRVRFLEFALELFERQTWPELELIVVGESANPLAALRHSSERIRTIRVAPGTSIGAKRNRAIDHARGDILVQWDDDDWYGSERVAVQVEPIVRGEGEITGLVAGHVFDLQRGEFWVPDPALRRQLFFEDVHGGTLAFTRKAWTQAGGYPPTSLAEDAEFLRRVQGSGGRLARLANTGHQVYVRHGQNAWSFAHGGRGWERRPTPEWMPSADLVRYRELAQWLLSASEGPVASAPGLQPDLCRRRPVSARSPGGGRR